MQSPGSTREQSSVHRLFPAAGVAAIPAGGGMAAGQMHGFGMLLPLLATSSAAILLALLLHLVAELTSWAGRTLARREDERAGRTDPRPDARREDHLHDRAARSDRLVLASHISAALYFPALWFTVRLLGAIGEEGQIWWMAAFLVVLFLPAILAFAACLSARLPGWHTWRPNMEEVPGIGSSLISAALVLATPCVLINIATLVPAHCQGAGTCPDHAGSVWVVLSCVAAYLAVTIIGIRGWWNNG